MRFKTNALFLATLVLAFAGCDSSQDGDSADEAAESSGDAGGACVAGAARCGDICVSLELDPSNCGACGSVCGADQRCAQGACVAGCGVDQEACGSQCVPLGECVGGCGSGEELCSGVCVPEGTCSNFGCGDGEVLCDEQCADLSSSETCGSCERTCAVGSPCRWRAYGYECVARDCVGVRAQMLADGETTVDGDYMIDPDGEGPTPVMPVYCADMQTEEPREYLNVDWAKNYSTQKFLSPPAATACQPCDRYVVSWEKLRLLIDGSEIEPGFAIDVTDKRFTRVTGYNRRSELDPACTELKDPNCTIADLHWGHVASCSRDDPRAEGLYNIAGSGLKFPADIVEYTAATGTEPADIEATLDLNRHELLMRFEAACGDYRVVPRDGEPAGIVILERDVTGPA